MAYFSFLLLIIVVNKVYMDDSCARGSACPPHKPFCSKFGCLNECPEPFYKNTTNCVNNCGEMFVDRDRNCVSECSTTQFVKEALKELEGIFVERKCVDTCPKYIFNKTCSNVCPKTNPFIHIGDSYFRDLLVYNSQIIANKFCVEQCPVSLKENFTYNGESITICTSECYRYRENGYCVESCSKGYFVYNDTCVSSCPQSHPILDKNGVCRELCTPINLEENTCICPDNEPFILNKTCSAQCAASMLAKHQNGKVFCVDFCDFNYYIYNKTCVVKCPFGMFNALNECVQQCPETMPYYCAIITEAICVDRNYILRCLEKCPAAAKYADQWACKPSCPFYTINETCHDTCPDTHPLTLNYANGTECNKYQCNGIIRQKRCLDECPEGYFKRNYDCANVCENNEHVFNETCLPLCPSQMKTMKHTLTYTEFRDEYTYYGRRYINETKSQLTNKCVDACESNEYQYNDDLGRN